VRTVSLSIQANFDAIVSETIHQLAHN